MRSEAEIDKYLSFVDSKTLSKEKERFMKESYIGCLPFEFLDILGQQVRHNKKVFESVIKKYEKNIVKAYKNGYSLCLLGNNGVGKTYFLCHILLTAISKKATVYYTTLPELEHNLKIGFSDRSHFSRLEYMLTSDFLAIDEVGKEQVGKRTESSYISSQFERILKKRFDNRQPVLLGTNLSATDIKKIYGSSIISIINGKYFLAQLAGDDYRRVLAKKMDNDMEYAP